MKFSAVSKKHHHIWTDGSEDISLRTKKISKVCDFWVFSTLEDANEHLTVNRGSISKDILINRACF